MTALGHFIKIQSRTNSEGYCVGKATGKELGWKLEKNMTLSLFAATPSLNLKLKPKPKPFNMFEEL